MKVTFDFESDGIDAFPNYPPLPRGLSILVEGQEPHYYAWGHPTENNCVEDDAKAELAKYWNDPNAELIAQNLAFDLAIAVKHWGFSLFPACTFHDTMVMAFLIDPHAKTYSLKPSAERYLGLPPEEQDAVHDWLVANGVCHKRQKDWGAYICQAPGGLVGEYANGDTIRTLRLFNEVYLPRVTAAGMLNAYRREMQLIPIMLENTLAGIAVDDVRLTNDVSLYERALTDIETLLFQELDCEPFNVDSDEQLADMIDQAYPGLQWTLTATGKRSTAKANIEKTLEGVGGKLGAILQYRASISTCLNTFMKPWLKQAVEGDGRIRCQWNTTRSDTTGARTGRLSSTPNFQNIPTLESAKFKRAIELHAEYLSAFPPLPNVRCYITADSTEDVLLDRDFSGQELRVMAHFEDGAALEAYRESPFLDLHQWAADFINSTLHLDISRKQTKTCIAKGSQVLTDSGLVNIENITGLHLVWDGVEYVNHSGVIAKGLQPVYTYKGLTATLDHEVFTDDYGKIDFGTAIAKRASIAVTGRNGQAIRAMASNFENSLAQVRPARWAHTHVLASTVRKLQNPSLGFVGQPYGRLLYKMSQLLYNKITTLPYFRAPVLGNKTTLRNATLPGVQMVWCAWYKVPIQFLRRICTVYRNLPAKSLLQGFAYRPHRQQWALPAGQYSSSYQFGERSQQVYEQIYRLQKPGGATNPLVAFAKDRLSKHVSRTRAYCQALSKWGFLGGCRVNAAAQGWSEVFDIANAGPRHRFTVSGCLVSNCGFAILYGSGLATLAAQMGATAEEAASVKSAYLDALPGLKDLISGLKTRARNNEPFRTWGGRVYYCEEPKFMDGRWRTFDYKMVNYLIQGSSADISKEAVIRYHKAKKHGRIILMVHDEICVSCPKAYWQEEMAILKECMEGIELDAKLVSDGEVGFNWHDLIPETKYE